MIIVRLDSCVHPAGCIVYAFFLEDLSLCLATTEVLWMEVNQSCEIYNHIYGLSLSLYNLTQKNKPTFMKAPVLPWVNQLARWSGQLSWLMEHQKQQLGWWELGIEMLIMCASTSRTEWEWGLTPFVGTRSLSHTEIEQWSGDICDSLHCACKNLGFLATVVKLR